MEKRWSSSLGGWEGGRVGGWGECRWIFIKGHRVHAFVMTPGAFIIMYSGDIHVTAAGILIWGWHPMESRQQIPLDDILQGAGPGKKYSTVLESPWNTGEVQISQTVVETVMNQE